MGIISDIFNFDNIGKKIKNFTKWSCWIAILLTWISAAVYFIILLFSKGTFLLAFLVPVVAIVYSLLIWVCCWTMYAVGEYIENIKVIRTQTATINNINKNLQIIAQPLIDEAKEKAKREAEEKADATAQQNGTTLSEQLSYALKFQSDEGMVRYLKDIQNENIRDILKSPQHLIREQIQNLLENI